MLPRLNNVPFLAAVLVSQGKLAQHNRIRSELIPRLSAVSGNQFWRTGEQLGHLLTRETGLPNTPAQCDSTCGTIHTDLETCFVPSCLCTPPNGRLIEKCVDCLVAADLSQLTITEAQTFLNAINFYCQDTVMPVLTLSVGPPGATSTSLNTLVTAGIDFSSLGVHLTIPPSSDSTTATSESQTASSAGVSHVVVTVDDTTPTSSFGDQTAAAPPSQIPTAASLTGVSKVTVTVDDPLPPGSSSGDFTPPNGASNLVVWNVVLGVGVGAVSAVIVALI